VTAKAGRRKYLVVEEELGEQAEALAVEFVLTPVHLEHADQPVVVDLLPRACPSQP
jgi:hypothetical protein